MVGAGMGSCQLCLACFLYFCKPISIIPKWPNRCHLELVKAQSHDSQEGRPGRGNQPAGSCLGPKSSQGEGGCLPGASIQKREKGVLPSRIF